MPQDIPPFHMPEPLSRPKSGALSSNRPALAIPFCKMHGLGNDFVVLDARTTPLDLSQAQRQRIADRRFGVGCDQLIVLEPSHKADVFMRIFNPDGGEVGACGNATRCIGALIMAERARTSVQIETLPGVLVAHQIGDEIEIDMGLPRLGWQDIPLSLAVPDTRFVAFAGAAIDPAIPATFSAVNMGNPHAVFFLETPAQPDAPPPLAALDLPRIGPVLEHHALFPQRANISFVQAAGVQDGLPAFTARVWERGAGITLACGTAACAIAVSIWRRELATGAVKIGLPGGWLTLSRSEAGHICMRGPASMAYRGILDPSQLAGIDAA